MRKGRDYVTIHFAQYHCFHSIRFKRLPRLSPTTPFLSTEISLRYARFEQVLGSLINFLFYDLVHQPA